MIKKELRVFGQTLNLHLRNEGDFAVADEVLVNRNYRACEETIKKASGCVIDIGAHLGFFSLMASLINPKVPIYSYEPHVENYSILKLNLRENQVQNVFPKQVAVSDQSGMGELILSKEDMNHSLTKAIEPTGLTQKVQTSTLEQIFQKNRIMRCDLLKMDCEGCEYKIVESTSKELFSKIDRIFLEYHDWDQTGHHAKSNELQKHLQKMGYKVQRFPNAKMAELGYLWATK
jgi:FkbM family methyltransferase